jgi:ParB/RepB/Spo0J family partition protein
LKRSIKEKGVIQPITVRRSEEGYEIIAGERRVRASKELGLETVPAYILDIDSDGEMLELALIENVQRENLNPVEIALGYHRLMEECGLTQEQVSVKVGKDRSTVANFLRLLRLPDTVQKLLRYKKITVGHARSFLALNTEDLMEEVAERVMEENLSVRQTEKLIKLIEKGEQVDVDINPPAVPAPIQYPVPSVTDDAVTMQAESSQELSTASIPVSTDGSNILHGTVAEVYEQPTLTDDDPIEDLARRIDDAQEGIRSNPLPSSSRSSNGPKQSQASSSMEATIEVAPENNQQQASMMKVESLLRETLGTQVRLTSKSHGGGTIQIEFYDSDHLEGLIDMLTSVEE